VTLCSICTRALTFENLKPPLGRTLIFCFFFKFCKAAIGADLSVHPDGDMTLDENEDAVAGYVEVSPSVVAGTDGEADVHRLGLIGSAVPAFLFF
jgi:hypothetical protein